MKRIVFMGTPDFAVPVLNRIVADGYEVVLAVTQPDRPKGRKRVLTPPPVKEAAHHHDIPVLQPEKINEEYHKVLAYQPDLIVTAAYGQILPVELLERPEYGCINVHASLLPELRGGAPIHYALLEGKKKTGITIMYMVKKLDAGDILTQTEVPITEEDHVGSLHDKLASAGAELLSETIPRLFKQAIQPIQQNEADVSFARNIKRDQEWINWQESQQHVYNHIRGLHPWPVAATYYQGKPLKVWWGTPVNQTFNGAAGEVAAIEADGFIVQTGDQKGIKLTSVQPSGKKRMSATDFLNGTGSSLSIGDKLGEQNE
ncbi:methionyl-tRNA formyltransferase [Thalassobacillus sp. CUG 92003]|uniref:methionyl-tRNA formyltransferase n=1 Tax=Thalassobacillus sp. CUG 92003 TaxID=2736641 RepID=UPI0015E7CCB0|nr:methionyl-tRNA formyltransferase [Thalassobacillus sp. CUG 92003]